MQILIAHKGHLFKWWFLGLSCWTSNTGERKPPADQRQKGVFWYKCFIVGTAL